MIIDTHSHIGKDYYFGESLLCDYDNFCKKNNINIGFLMPMPWPVMKTKNKEICSLIWEHENYELINYYKLIKFNGDVKKEKIKTNPYKDVNEYYFNLISKSSTNTKIYFVPMLHGVLDEPFYVDELIKKQNPVALKIHGFSEGFFANDIKQELVEIIKYYDIPIILHTSVYNYDEGYGLNTKFWRNKCSPKLWTDFLLKNNLKGVLNHGACLDKEVINLVNKNDNLMIGIGPDLDISQDPYKVLIQKDQYLKQGYLNILKKNVSPEKLLFDVDFNWNTDNKGNIDYNQAKRIESVWSDKDVHKIFCGNAKRFYNKIAFK